MVTQVSDRMPGSVKWALAGVWYQALSNVAVGLWLLSLVNERRDHNQDVPHLGLVQFSLYVALLAGVALLVCAVCAGKRFRWVRTTILAVECASALITLINILVSGLVTQVIGLLITFAVSRTMLSEPGRQWFNRGYQPQH
jgi:O-antigen ligase